MRQKEAKGGKVLQREAKGGKERQRETKRYKWRQREAMGGREMPTEKKVFYWNLLSKETTKGEGHKIRKMGRHRLLMAPNRKTLLSRKIVPQMKKTAVKIV